MPRMRRGRLEGGPQAAGRKAPLIGELAAAGGLRGCPPGLMVITSYMYSQVARLP